MILDLLPEAAARARTVAQMYADVAAAFPVPAFFGSAPSERDVRADLPLLRRALVRDDAPGAVAAVLNQRAVDDLRAHRPAVWLLRDGSGWSGDATTRVTLDSMRGNPLAAAFVEDRGSGPVVRAVGVNGQTACVPLTEALWTNPLMLDAGGAPIALDLQSPIAREIIASKSAFSLLDDACGRVLHEKLAAALALLGTTWPKLFRSVGASVSLIVASTTTARSGTTALRYGASTASFPGVIFMNDYHCPQISLEEVAENVVHETIHNMIVDQELIEPWYAEGAGEQITVARYPSPWSDRVLSFYSLFHSLFVFTAIGEWLGRVQESRDASESARAYARERLADLGPRFAAVFGDRARYGLAEPLLSVRGRAWLAALVDEPEHWSRARATVAHA